MKLVDDKGHFQFIKNGQVIIDNNLPKYARISEEQKKRNDIAAGLAEDPVYTYVGVENNYDDPIQHFISPGTTIDADGRVASRNLTTPGSDNVDKQTRETISSLKASDLQKFFMSKDAKEFNEKFLPILQAEQKNNSYSVNVTYNNWVVNEVQEAEPTSLFKKLVNAIKDVFDKNAEEKRKQKDAENAALRVIDFFNIIHVESGKEKEFVNKLEGYFSLIRNASLMHQQAQLDDLCQNIILHIYESVLAFHGMNKYIPFREIEKMKCVGKKVVDIDYIKNFGRVIPDSIVEKKLFADNLGVFDNYCVMYYDPSGETYKTTAAAKRDPILFGLINHSEKLYYIADWVDDLCDLTLDKVAELCTVKDVETDKAISAPKQKKDKKKNKKKK